MRRFYPFLTGVAAFCLYLFSGARTVQWQDSGQFVLRVGTGQIDNEWGLAMVHPLHFHLARAAAALFPANIPWAVAGVSALGGGLAVALLALCVRRSTGSDRSALFAALSLTLAHTFWRFSGLPEVYTLSAALLLLEVLAWMRLRDDPSPLRWVLLFCANGLAFSNHNLALLSLPVWGISLLIALARKQIAFRHVVFAGLGWLVASLPYTSLVALEFLQSRDLAATLHSALFGYHFADQVTGVLPRLDFLLISLAFLVLSFPGLLLPLAVREILRGKLPRPLLFLLLIHLAFVLRYNVIDQYSFLVPVFPLIVWIGAQGWHRLPSRRLQHVALVLVLLQPLLYFIAPTLARHSGVLKTFSRNKPYRDDATYLLWPWTFLENSAARVAAEAVSAAGPAGNIVVEDAMGVYAVAWELHQQGHSSQVRLLRPADHEKTLAALAANERVVWIPARSDSPVPEHWHPYGAVWVNEE